MPRGFSLVELVMRLALAGLIVVIVVPRLAGVLDALAVERAARAVTTALSAARHAAILQASRTRLVIGTDSLRLDRWGGRGWEALSRWPGPVTEGVALRASNREVVFGPTGIGRGTANTRVLLRRGAHSATITTSRLGRVKRW